LNKCIDAGGKVTYSNLPCRNAQEVRKLEIDPAPPPQPVRPQAVQKPAPSAPAVPSASPEPPTPVAQPEPTAPATPRMQVSPAAPKAPAIAIEPTPKRIEVRPPHTKPAAARASANQCDALTEQLGRVFDKMDAARRVGATQEQMNTWNEEVKELERKKQQSGCF
ncbi:MAG TPA: hypothetical protein VFX83_11460, partial [Azonexus sp.]|nr:hypothetical protein [Azonexus sp.]